MSCDYIASLDTVRLTRINECGLPVVGAGNAYASSCVASSISLNPVVDEQDDIIYKGPSGNLCAVKRGCPTLLGYDVEINFFQVSPQLLDIMTGNPTVLGFDGAPVGWDDCSINCKEGFALEFWSELIGACTTDTTPNNRYLYTLVPWLTNASIGDLEIGGEAVSFTLNASTRAGGRWGTGPYDVVPTDALNTPGRLLTPLGTDCHRRFLTTTITPPASSCEYLTVPALVP